MTKHHKDACGPFLRTECLSCMTGSRTLDLVILNEILFSFHWYSKYGVKNWTQKLRSLVNMGQLDK